MPRKNKEKDIEKDYEPIKSQKKNPDILELTRGKTSQVIGYLTSILTTTKGLPSGYSRDLQQIKSSIWSTSKISITRSENETYCGIT